MRLANDSLLRYRGSGIIVMAVLSTNQSEANTAAMNQAESEPWVRPSVGRWIVGIPLYNLFSWFYDYCLYAFVIWQCGFFLGGALLTVTTAVIDLCCLKFYDSAKQDWLALEYLKAHKYYRGRNPLRKGFGWLLRETPIWLQIVALTPKSNAFLTTALLRDGAYSYSSMTSRDWFIFWGSFICSQIYWTVLVWTGVQGVIELVALAIGGRG
jgi:hypothetical protein